MKVPLRKLFTEDEEAPSSSSSSEVDEMEAIPPGTYCVWKPKVVEASHSTCKKSKSTGFGSKRWKLRDLLRRSNSEGKDSFVFLTKNRKSTETTATTTTAEKSVEPPPDRRRTFMRGDETPKRKAYLPYRQDFVGFFTTVNTLGRNFSPR
ncbi:hypothetical protein Leryth_022925 [Lithospermum erythrorhizon]|nr:hypothetical protein Leryth_022925 [Lithospermum erythrorhizon]